MRPLLESLAERGFELHALSNYPSWYRLVEQKLELSKYCRFCRKHTKHKEKKK